MINFHSLSNTHRSSSISLSLNTSVNSFFTRASFSGSNSVSRIPHGPENWHIKAKWFVIGFVEELGVRERGLAPDGNEIIYRIIFHILSKLVHIN